MRKSEETVDAQMYYSYNFTTDFLEKYGFHLKLSLKVSALTFALSFFKKFLMMIIYNFLGSFLLVLCTPLVKRIEILFIYFYLFI